MSSGIDRLLIDDNVAFPPFSTKGESLQIDSRLLTDAWVHQTLTFQTYYFINNLEGNERTNVLFNN